MRFSGRRLALAGGLACGLAGLSVATLLAQQNAPFRSATNTISLFATVTDAQNRLVPDLTQGDFDVFDNDKSQPLLVFNQETLPIRVVMMLDTSGSMTGSIALLKKAGEQFLLRLLPDDRATVGAFNDKIEVGTSLSANRDQLIAEVKDLDFGNGTRLYDAINEGITLLHSVEGRKVILVFTDGDDTSSHVGRGTVLDRARAEEVMIYANRPGVGVLRRRAHGSQQARWRVEAPGRRNRRRLFRTQENHRSRTDLHARRPGTTQPVRTGLRGPAAGRQSSQAFREDEADRADGASP